MVVGVGDSDDGTRDKILALNDPKIRIIDTVWDMANRSGGTILSQQTNLVLPACTGDWVCYIQGDEVAMENDFGLVRGQLEQAAGRDDIDGIAFSYLHFYGSYYTIQPGRNWYSREVRIIRNGRGIVSHGDAQGFRRNGAKIRGLESAARMFHYGWARPPDVMAEKIRSFHKFWHDDSWVEQNCGGKKVKEFFSDLGNLTDYNGPHPAAMAGTLNRDSEPFIKECRADYLKARTLKQTVRDLVRGLPLGRHRNYIPVRK